MNNLLIDVERGVDMSEDITGYAIERIEKDVVFSLQARDELTQLSRHTHQTYQLVLEAFENGDRELARRVCGLEEDFDQIYWQTRQNHIERLERGICQLEADVIFTEILHSLEQISEDADNFGVRVSRS